MIYRVLADLVVIVHFAYVLGVILGLLAILLGWLLNWEWVRNRWFRGIHLLMILVVVIQAWFGVKCPLTVWEQQLRKKAGEQTYQGDFIANWAHETLFIQAEAWVFTLCYSIFGGLVLATLFLVKPRWRRPHETDAE
jgi:H+/Cl- antiporter ClcA